MRTRSGRSNQVGQGAATAGATATTDSGDTSANATAPIPVSSASISPPYMTDVSHAALVKWKRERQEYEEAIEARCSVTGEDKGKALRSVKNSFNRQLLSTLCRLEWGTTVEEVTDARIIVELDKIVGNVMNDAILDVDAIFDDELKMNLRERDVKARVINYFMRCDEIILQHGMASIFSTETGKKEKCNILRKHLEPAALREAVDTHLRIVDASSKSDESALYMLVKEKALEQERVYQLLAKRRHQPTTSHNTGKTKSDGDQGSRHSNQRSSSDRKVEKPSERGRSVQAQTKPTAASQGKPRTGCFHCGKDHWLSQCPDLDEAAKEAILAERKSKRGVNNEKNKKLRSKRVDAPSTANKECRPTVVINGSLELPYCADSGSDMNIISRKHVDLLREQDAAVVLVELDAPITSRAVGGALLTSTHTVEARLTLNTAAGPVRCQDAKKCLIVETDEDEFIVGKLLLAELGIDVDRQLEYLA
eukprot:jgi/Phyca11/96370/e_gw1.1.345.1